MERQSDHSGLRKLGVACRTCGVSESFYSSTSVSRFRLEHLGHEVVEWEPREDTGQSVRVGGRMKLLKVLVELVMLPDYPAPVFTVTGVKEDLKSAFVQVIPPSQRDLLNETLERGKYLDSGSSDTVYAWDPRAIIFSDDARMAMSFGTRALGGATPPPGAPAGEDLQVEDNPATGEAERLRVASSGGYRSVLALDEVLPGGVPVFLETPSAGPEQDGPGAPQLGPAEGLRHGAEGDGYLLLSKSFFMEAGAKNIPEAVRISKLLRPFRWKVEPAYMVGVIVDDILSIESANGEIGGDMTRQIEAAGYRLSRVSLEKGRPVAWFKRETAGR